MIKITDLHVENVGVGVRTSGPVDLDIKSASFKNVKIPYAIDGANEVNIADTRITDDPKVTLRETSKERSSIGWTRSLDAGPPLPSFCPKCLSVFPSENYRFSGDYFNLWGNEDVCPECGFEHATLSEGVFKITKETIEVLCAPDMTHAMLRALRNIADAALSGSIPADEAIAKIEKISPGLGRQAKECLIIGAAVLGTFFGGICAYYEWIDHRTPRGESVSSDQALSAVLNSQATARYTLHGVVRQEGHKDTESPRAKPTDHKATQKASTAKLDAQRKPKAREIRRQAERKRRELDRNARRAYNAMRHARNPS